MRIGSTKAGITIVELLVASLILVVLLGTLGVFFARQTDLQRRVQARNEVQDRIRVAMQLVTQDLALAGNSTVIDSTGARSSGVTWPFCFDGARGCLELANEGPVSSTVQVRYVSSQFPAAEACRDVTYRLSGSTLQRSDVECGDLAAFVDLAPDVLEFKVSVICSTGTAFDEFPVSGCGSSVSYGRSALVFIAGQSSNPINGVAGEDCDEGRICFDVQQEVLIPNMKDQ